MQKYRAMISSSKLNMCVALAEMLQRKDAYRGSRDVGYGDQLRL